LPPEQIDIMKKMKRLLFFLGCSGVLLQAADLSTVRSVYVLPMSRGLDQYLANRLTNEHMFQVVTDPKLADAVFTYHIGESFQSQMDTLYPPPPPPEKPKVEVKEDDTKRKKAAKDKDDDRGPGLLGEPVNKLSNPASNSGFGRARGTVFLVEAKSHQVVWSVFDPPKGTTNTDLDKVASDIVSRIKKELNPAAVSKTKN